MKISTPNVILLTIDCLRFDHLGCYGYWRDTSPNIDNLASKGALFLEAISNGGITPFAFPSILASALPPLEEGEDREILRRNSTLAGLLKEAGYRTAAFHSNPYLARPFNYGKGFDIFEDSQGKMDAALKQKFKLEAKLAMRLKPLKASRFGRSVIRFLAKLWWLPNLFSSFVAGPPIIRAGGLTRQAIQSLATHKGKFFLWLHYMDVHRPYMPFPEYLSQFRTQPVSRRKMVILFHKIVENPSQLSPSEVTTLVDLYDADIKYVDDAVGRLLDSLGSDLSNTIVIVTADHGQEFEEHGKFGYQTLYDTLVHVPLIIAGPGIKGGTLVKQQVSLIDLAPTIADFLGIDNAPSFHGESLLPVIRSKREAVNGTISTTFRPGQRLIAYRIPGWKYILTESLDANDVVLAEELYDLTNDPGETKNLHGVDIEEAKRFQLEARNKLSQFKQLKSKEKTAYAKQRIKAKFKKLGKL
ncbi:Ulvan-active sulfatase [subsurface metagenome]